MDIFKKAPFSSLRAFEAVGRLQSFALAAVELGISSSAISHSVKKLEELIGKRLFQRSTREVMLTGDGVVLLEYIQHAFHSIQRGLSLITQDDRHLLRIHSAPSFAHQWLLPRLGDFMQSHSDIELRLSASTDYVKFEYDEFDLDIVYGEPESNYKKIALCVEELTPLCSPQLAQKIQSPEDLYKLPLIQCDIQLYQWSGWFEANGLTAPDSYALRFDRSFMAISAASDGIGVVLESKLLAEKEIASGRLVAPLVDRTEEIHYIGHNLVYSAEKEHNIALTTFINWLLEQLNQGKHR